MVGLLDFLGGNRAQVPGQQPGLFQTLLDPAVALPMAAALMGNQGNMQNIGAAFGAGGQAIAQTREQSEEKQRQNQTYNWLKQNAPEFAQLMDGGLDANSALEMYAKQRYAQQSDPYKSVGGHIFDTRSQSWISPPEGADGAPKVGLNPILMQDAEGNYRYVQPTDRGELMPSTVPDGLRPVGPYDKSFQTQSGSAAGKGQGEAIASFQSMQSKMPGLEFTVKQLDELASKATYTVGGQLIDSAMRQAGMEPREAALARAEYIAMVDNQILPLLRDTFGAQFTEREGETLRKTLGDPNASPQEKQAILKAFIEQKRRDIEALAMQSGQPPQGQRLRFNPATGELE